MAKISKVFCVYLFVVLGVVFLFSLGCVFCFLGTIGICSFLGGFLGLPKCFFTVATGQKCSGVRDNSWN